MSDKGEVTASKNEQAPVKLVLGTASEQQAIREQLASVLESLPFKTSKRCASFLSHVVEKALRSETDDLKERTLGIEVFHRDPAYDTNSDPVVRMAASETRRRLAQYYDDPTRRKQIRIQLSQGSYAPEFYIPSEAKGRENSQASSGPSATREHAEANLSASLAETPPLARSKRPGLQSFLIPVLCLLLGLFLSAPASRIRNAVSSAPLSALDKFWQPLLTAPGTVWLCVGEAYAPRLELDPNGARNRFDAQYGLTSHSQKAYPTLNLADTMVLVRVAGVLQSRSKSYTVHGKTETTFSDLAGGPAVLIGSFNNDWTIRLTDQLRFHFEMDRDAGEQWIVDNEKPGQKIGTHIFNLATPDTGDAYAIISRVRDPSTGQIVLALSGVSVNGTKAAGAFVSEPGYLEDFASHAPPNWKSANLQILIAASLVDGSLGPPRVVSSYIW